MAKKAVKYSVVDAYTGTAFKGNPAAVCIFEEEAEERDDGWLQSVAAEFNISQTCFLTPTTNNNNKASANPTFRLRWFTPVAEVKLCGHATLAAAHFLFTSGLVTTDIVEFSTLSGILTAKRIPHPKNSTSPDVESGERRDGFSIELNFPLVKLTEYNFHENVSLPQTLNGASPVEILATENDVFVVLSSAKEVAELQPQFDEIQRLPGRGLIVTGLTPPGSEFDFYSRFFCPKHKINEDPVCGSAHCAIAPYWCQKLKKRDLVGYQASPRGGILNLHVDETNQRILLGGKAITIMEGSILV